MSITKLDIINSNPPVILVNGEKIHPPFGHYGTTIDTIVKVLEASDTTVVAEEFELFEVDSGILHWDYSDLEVDNSGSVCYS
jgi:hypothetical protein